jgi:C4-dicarboxylate-specific signal transduction histidine kinase
MSHLHPGVQLLLLSGLVIFWLIPFSSWLMLRKYRDQNANLWFIGTAIYSLVATLFVFGSALPVQLRGPLSMTLAFSSLLCLAESLRRETSDRPCPWRVYLLATCSLFGFLALLVPQNLFAGFGQAASLTLLSVTEVYLMILTDRARRKHQSTSLWVVMGVFAAFVLSNISRVLEWLTTGRYSQLLDFTALSNVALMVNYLSVIFYCYGYWGYVVEKKQRQLVLATEQTVMARESEKLAIEREKITQSLLRERTDLMARLAMVGKHAQSGALSASIAHELNQPLAAIKLNIQEARRMACSISPLSSALTLLPILLERIEQDNQRAASIVRRVRQMFTQKQSQTESLVLDSVVHNIVECMSQRLATEGVQIDLVLDTAAPFRFASGEMEHVLMNLIDNAIDAFERTPEGEKRIDIRTWRDTGWVYLSVSDTGPGVPDNLRETVFELSETSKLHGMGVGLWLSRYIVERHGGFLRLSPQSQPGARFLVQVPDQ